MTAENATAVATESSVATLMGTGERPTRVRGEELPQSRVATVTVVVPAKNEATTIGSVLGEVRTVLASQEDLEFDIIVVDDGSTDSTGVVAAGLGARVVRHHQSLGNGAAVKRGIREATGDWILLLDADGQHPAHVIPELLATATRCDMVVASRQGRGGALHRDLANRIYSALASYVAARAIPDLTSGFRLVRADVAKGLVYLLPNTFSYPTTITMSMLRSGYAVEFVPFKVRPRADKKSHVRLLKDGSRFFLIILRIATFFAPLRVFLPLSLLMAALGVGWYVYTYFTQTRFTNMAALLLTQATVIFVLGLISEQVAASRYGRLEERPRR